MRGNFMENDICDLARAVTVSFETIFEAFNALAEACEKFFACATDLFGDIEEQFLKTVLKKLRPDYKDKCKIRWLDIPNKVMQGRIRRFC